MRIASVPSFILASLLIAAQPAGAAEEPAYSGLWISTPYPAMSIGAGETAQLNVAVHGENVAPERADLRIADVPKGWTAAFIAKGEPIRAVFVGPKESPELQLRIDPPRDVAAGTYHMSIGVTGQSGKFDLPIDLTVATAQPAKLKAEADFPALKGTQSSSFEFPIHLTNESDQNALAVLSTDAPDGFQVSFTEGYQTQQITSVAIKAGEKKDIKAKVAPPDGVEAGTYDLVFAAIADKARAEVPLTLQVTGQPKLSMTAPGGLLSGHAYAGEETPIDLVLRNEGSAAAAKIKLHANEPTGWKVSFVPDQIDSIAPNGSTDVKALITPASKAIAGDYMVSFRANGSGASASTEYRETVRTSTLWGITGVVVTALALLVLMLAVRRYGRR